MPEHVEQLVGAALRAAQEDGSLPGFEVADLGLERPADPANGDWTTTLALRSAKLAHKAPKDIAAAIASHMPQDPSVERCEVAGPGFMNIYLTAEVKCEPFRQAIEQGADFGRSELGNGQKVQVEFVSANPVGPMHVGHGRWCALGDSLSRVMEHAGFDVEREYYINDHGSQMDVFGSSLAVRYEQLTSLMSERGLSEQEAYDVLVADRDAYVDDEQDEAPETHPLQDAFNEQLGGNAYGGTYIIDIAREFLDSDGTRLLDMDEAERMHEMRERGYHMMLDRIRATCHEARCDFDVWFSERSLYQPGPDGEDAVHRAFDRLREGGYLYETEDGALWFRSTDFGDDKDRVLVKSNGEYTYFASDVAYHLNKFARGAEYSIDLWGADHHGYIARVTNVCDALGFPGKFEVDLGQFVNLLRNGEPVRMSKRRGTMVSFQELLDEVGVDATRYTLISKSANQTIDFDIEAAKKQEASNPVFYVQYAHARICSILRRAAGVSEDEAKEMGMDAVAAKAIGSEFDAALLTDASEAALARKLSEFPELVASCARDRAPFRLTHFCEELASSFHNFYQHCQVLPSEGRPVDPELSRARLAAIDAVRINLEVALGLIGVSAPKVM